MRAKFINELMSEIPIDVKKISSKNINEEVLRIGIVAELDAINLYEQLSEKATNSKIKKLFLDIAKEEKTHVGEFEAALLMIDKEYKEELKKGKMEFEKL
jgi:rubrerythrin